MNGEIVDGTKHAVIDLDEYGVEIVRGVLNDELAVGIAWETLNLVQTELYITLRIVEYVLLNIGINLAI